MRDSATSPLGISVLRRSATKLIHEAEARGATVLDVTSRGPQPWVQFSPFYPHGGIPVPLWPGYTSASVEGAWQAFKVFERQDIELNKLRITTMKRLKRSSRTLGRVLGHRAGADSDVLLPYVEARQRIYLPLYRWVLQHNLVPLVEQIRSLSTCGRVVLLDYETNTNVEDPRSPLSHAGLVRLHLEGSWPS